MVIAVCVQQAHVPKYIPAGSAAHILDIGRAVRLLSQPPDSFNAFNPSAAASRSLSASSAALPRLIGARVGQPPGAPEAGGGPQAYPPPDGAQTANAQAGVVQLDLATLSAGLQKLATMPKFSGIAFETTITDIHEQVLTP